MAYQKGMQSLLLPINSVSKRVKMGYQKRMKITTQQDV